LVLRINPDGTLDSTFGVDGEAKADFSNAFSGSDLSDGIAYGVALQPDGDIVAVGTATDSDGTAQFAVARFEPDGDLDPTFGTDGEVIVSQGDPYEGDFVAYSVAME